MAVLRPHCRLAGRLRPGTVTVTVTRGNLNGRSGAAAAAAVGRVWWPVVARGPRPPAGPQGLQAARAGSRGPSRSLEVQVPSLTRSRHWHRAASHGDPLPVGRLRRRAEDNRDSDASASANLKWGVHILHIFFLRITYFAYFKFAHLLHIYCIFLLTCVIFRVS